MKNFNIPGIQSHFELNTWILKMMKEHPECFYPDVKISSIYGNFQYCIWDGGRDFYCYKQMTEEQILDIKKTYEYLNVPLRFAFNNCLLEKKHLYNRFCNLQLEIFHNGINEVVVNSPILEEYIRINYPKYKIISSTTKRLLKPENSLEELKKDYYQVCLDYDLNKDMNFLNKIPKELRNKCEFLINANCQTKCPERLNHYIITSKKTLTYLKDKTKLKNCGMIYDMNHPQVLGQRNNLSLEDIDKYNKMGYHYFKLEGRNLESIVLLLNYLYFMVKPEWHAEMILWAKEYGNILFNSFNDINKYFLN